MKTKIAATFLMTALPHRLNGTDSLGKVQDMMELFGVRHLPVVKGHKVIGIISNNDITRLSINDFETNTAEDIMTSPVTCIQHDDYLEDFVSLFTDNGLHSVPVLNNMKELIGIISTVDMIQWLYITLKTNSYVNKNSD